MATPVKVTMEYTETLPANENVDQWLDDFRDAVEMSLRGRYGYTGKIHFGVEVDAPR